MLEKEIRDKIRGEAAMVLGRVVLFLVYYVGLILLGIGLIVGMFFLSKMLFVGLLELEYINLRVLIIGGILWLAMWWFCIQMALYLVRPLFMVNRDYDDSRREVDRDDCPELFAMIEDVAGKTGNKMPSHVYLSAEQNACVFYETTSIWSVFFPTGKSLMVGTGLLYGLNESELKAIIAHEFGHFSQHSMKVGTITYRLLLVIRGMIELTQEEQHEAALSRADSDSSKAWFHIAGDAMASVTRLTIRFYNYIEKKNRSLSRYMEFEADAVACKIVGARPFISSICKLEVLSRRYGMYENIIARLLQEKKYIGDYERGYEIVENLFAEDEGEYISYDQLRTTLANRESKFPSRIVVIDGWNTHPSVNERIENASQFVNDSMPASLKDSRLLVKPAVISVIGLMRQQFFWRNIMEEDEPWNKAKEMLMDEFKTWALELMKNESVIGFLSPFLNREIIRFNMPTDEELANPVKSPFTEDNNDLQLEYSVALNDWCALNELSSEDDSQRLMYAGSEYDNVSKALTEHKGYLDGLYHRLSDLDKHVFIYLCQRTGDEDRLKMIYWKIFYSVDSVNAMRDILDWNESIKQQTTLFYENGKQFSINDDVRMNLLQKLWDFLRSFEFVTVNNCCGDMMCGEEQVRNILRECVTFASAECDYSIDIDSIIHMTDDIYNVVVLMHNSGMADYTEIMKQVYGQITSQN